MRNELHDYINAKLAKVAIAPEHKTPRIEIIHDAALQMQYKDRLAIVFRNTIENRDVVELKVYVKENSIKYIGGVLVYEEVEGYVYPLANKDFVIDFENKESDGWIPISAVVY